MSECPTNQEVVSCKPSSSLTPLEYHDLEYPTVTNLLQFKAHIQASQGLGPSKNGQVSHKKCYIIGKVLG